MNLCGVADDRIPRLLLAEPTLTFEKAKDIALAMALADKNMTALREQGKQMETVNEIAQSSGRSDTKQHPFSKKSPARGRCGKRQCR